jgi:hypothetical protein
METSEDLETNVPPPTSTDKKELFKHEIDADEALEAVEGREGEAIELDAETERRLLRKIDWNLMPVGFESFVVIMG